MPKNNLEEKIEEILEELSQAIEYHRSHDIGLNQVSLIKQEIGVALLSKLPEVLKQFAQEITEEILVEEGIEWMQEGTKKELRGYTKGFNECLKAIKAKRDKLLGKDKN